MSRPNELQSVLELELQSSPNILPPVRERVRHWALQAGWTAEQTSEITLAVDEALTNVIRHGYCCESTHPICFQMRTIEDPVEGPGIEVRIRDYGRQVDPAEICGRDLDDVRPGGLGVHLIRAMMSSAEYSKAEGGGMLLVMRKYRPHTTRRQPPSGQDA